MSVHERMKIIREVLNLTQEELGARMGRKQSEVSKWETGKQAITMEVLEDFIRVTHLSNDHLLYLIRDQESGKELQPMIIRKHFTAEEMQKAFEFLSDEPEFTNEINILSNYPEKQKRKLINNMISLLKNERDH